MLQQFESTTKKRDRGEPGHSVREEKYLINHRLKEDIVVPPVQNTNEGLSESTTEPVVLSRSLRTNRAHLLRIPDDQWPALCEWRRANKKQKDL